MGKYHDELRVCVAKNTFGVGDNRQVDKFNTLHPIESRLFLGEDGIYLYQGDSKASWSSSGYSVRQKSIVWKPFLAKFA